MGYLCNYWRGMGSHWPSYTTLMQPSWVCQCVNTPRLTKVTSTTSAINTSLMVPWTLKQTTQYNKYYIWNLKLEIQIKLSMALLELINHESFFIHGIYKKADLPLPHHIINCRLLVAFHPNTFACFYILGFSRSNQNYKVLITFHLSLTLKEMDPTPHVVMLRS
jgi:hypothetical protein